MFAAEVGNGTRLVPGLGNDCEGVCEFVDASPRWRVGVAVGLVFVLFPSGTDSEDEPSAGQHLECRRHLGEKPRVAVALAEFNGADSKPRPAGCGIGKTGPRFESWCLAPLQVVGDPQISDVAVQVFDE